MQELKKIVPKDKKGQVGFNLTKSAVIVILTIIILLFAGLITVTQLKNSGVFTSGSAGDNDTTNLMNNFSYGATKLGGYVPTVMIMLGVLILIGIVVVLIVFISRSTGGGTGI